ncbi:SWIM zinc finger family protein [Desulfonema ishimotonii]|uniref:SWIM zinc finger family protein n=1 Tax=Desulfonema ishimotonii TaxID=45657 RepID=A0A401FXU9_9BACT|nr:SWIM zinc finger family protein [Desulfonema ishimotonii]GBC61797.1 SWIM zinc finger family protein [Desulfonema ishimotonii]
MEFNYKYHGSSAVSSNTGQVGISFAPDTFREPTFFTGRLNKHIPFREAISALHDVVVSDLRFRPRDRTEYKEWAAQQEAVWLAEFMAQAEDVSVKVSELRAELDVVRREKQAIIGPFNTAKKEYFNYLYKRDYDAWFVLDPVITVHPDELFFECFSQDESAYGRLSCDYNVYKEVGEFACGTTNIDYSSALYNEFQKVREYKETEFSIDPSGFAVQTTGEESYKEVKIDLPESWVRGFLQVSSAMTLPARTFELHPMDVHNFCFILRRHKEKKGPRSMRFILKPGEPVQVVFEPWNYVVTCARSVYKGDQADEIRIWGRRRLLILERLIPVARKFTVSLLGSGLPSFYVADLGDMAFTLGLSGWTANDWSRAGNFDLMAPRAETDGMTQQQVWLALKETWLADTDTLAARLDMARDTVLGALSAFVQAGRAIYDLNKGVWRVRELSREPLPMDKLRFSNEREASARRFVDDNAVFLEMGQTDGGLRLSGTVTEKGKSWQPELVTDADQRMVQAECTCNFYQQNKLYKGPCEHMLALRIAHRERRDA